MTLRRARPGPAREQLSTNSIRQLHRNPEMLHQYGPALTGQGLRSDPWPGKSAREAIRHRTPAVVSTPADPARAVVSVDPRRLDLRPHLRSGHPASTAALRRTHRARRRRAAATTTSDSTDTSQTPRIRSPFTPTAGQAARRGALVAAGDDARLRTFNSQQRFPPQPELPAVGESPASRKRSPPDTPPPPASSMASPSSRTTTAPAPPGTRGSTRALSGWNGACCATPAMSWSWPYR